MGLRIVRIQPKGALELVLGARPVPISIESDARQRSVCLSQRIVEIQGLERVLLCLRDRHFRRKISGHRIVGRQGRIASCIFGVD